MDISYCTGGMFCPFKLRSNCLRYNLHINEDNYKYYATYFMEAPYDEKGKCDYMIPTMKIE